MIDGGIRQGKEHIMNNDGRDSGTYTTRDFLEICFLLASDMRLRQASVENNYGRVAFIFEEGDACRELTGKLVLGNDMVSASRFMDATKRARKVIVACQSRGQRPDERA